MRGELKNAPGNGWKHGPTPRTPAGLTETSRRVWRIWMGSWVASLWKPEDVPGLESVIRLYDRNVLQPSSANATALGQWMDRYGLTPKGLQDRRWLAPKEEEPAPAASTDLRRLRVVGE